VRAVYSACAAALKHQAAAAAAAASTMPLPCAAAMAPLKSYRHTVQTYVLKIAAVASANDHEPDHGAMAMAKS
jgi:hypothetical protein